MIVNKTPLRIACSLLAAAALAVGCAGTKPVPQAEVPKAPVVDAAAVARKAAEEAAAKAKEVAAAEARKMAEKEAAARKASEEAARQARQFAPAYFDYDKYQIRDGEKELLTRYAERLTDRSEFAVTLEGHCDERGTTAYNLALGQKRADEVRNFLTRAGVAAERLTTISYGKERPADPRHDESGWSKNRRVEVVVTN